MNNRTFADELKRAREAQAVTLEAIAEQTRIPVSTLERLENGRFEELPADVFVRGFLRQYARCVGLAPEETVRRYRRSRSISDTGQFRLDQEAYAEAVILVEESGAVPNPTGPTQLVDVPPASTLSARVGSGSGRVGITLTVIILVIVATLTLSYLLRDPRRPGDGVTQRTHLLQSGG